MAAAKSHSTTTQYRQLRRLLVSRRNDVSSRENQSPVPGSQIVGKTRKRKAREKLAGREKGFLPVLFVCLFFHVRASSKPAAILTRGSNYVRACFFAR